MRWLLSSVALLTSFGMTDTRPVSAPPSFEVATIKQNKSLDTVTGMFPSPGILRVMNYTLRQLIQDTYNVRRYQILRSPGWTSSEKYDIEAKTEGKVDLKQLRVMLANLLASRFQLKFHRETRSLPVYSLVIAKNGPKLGEPEQPDSGAPTLQIRKNEFFAHKVSMTWFASALSGQLNRPVLNNTGLPGDYNFTLLYTSDEAQSTELSGSSDVSIFTAIQEQLGLKLLPQKGPIEVLVIDHVERPSEN